MATLPADEDYARAVLAIFRAKNVRARQSLRVGDVEAAFLIQNMGRPADFEAALQYATSQGWLARALDMVRLTPPGDEEMQTISWPLRGADPLSPADGPRGTGFKAKRGLMEIPESDRNWKTKFLK